MRGGGEDLRTGSQVRLHADPGRRAGNRQVAADQAARLEMDAGRDTGHPDEQSLRGAGRGVAGRDGRARDIEQGRQGIDQAVPHQDGGHLQEGLCQERDRQQEDVRIRRHDQREGFPERFHGEPAFPADPLLRRLQAQAVGDGTGGSEAIMG